MYLGTLNLNVTKKKTWPSCGYFSSNGHFFINIPSPINPKVFIFCFVFFLHLSRWYTLSGILIFAMYLCASTMYYKFERHLCTQEYLFLHFFSFNGSNFKCYSDIHIVYIQLTTVLL